METKKTLNAEKVKRTESEEESDAVDGNSDDDYPLTSPSDRSEIPLPGRSLSITRSVMIRNWMDQWPRLRNVYKSIA